MKDKKRVLTVLLVLIIIVTTILVVVNFVGSNFSKEVNKYHDIAAKAACDMASKEGYTKAICENFPNLCRVKYPKLVNEGYLEGDLVNPQNGKKAKEDTTNYIEITWKENQMECIHKEG